MRRWSVAYGWSPLVSALLFVSTSPLRAENWPQWRGGKLDGISHEKNLPARFSKTENVAWRLPLPGPAGSTPVVWGDRIFLTTAEGSDLVLLCVSTDGQLLWSRKLGAGNRNLRGDEGNLASPSPCTDGRHVWSFMGNGVLGCYDFDGNQVWQFDLQERYGKFDIQFGMSSTPVLDGDRLYMQIIHSGGAYLLALDKATGAEVWKADRPSDAIAECEHSYASPVLYRDGQREFLVSHGADFTIGHSLADGKELWRVGGFNPKGRSYEPTLRFISTPVAVPGLIVAPSAKNHGVIGVRSTATGDVTDSRDHLAWTLPNNTPDVPSPLVVDGLAYLCRENGLVICLDAESGVKVYEQRAHSDRYRASPVFADGKIYLTARGGVVTVIKPGREFTVLAENDLEEPISASPAVSGGRIYFRTFDALWAVEQQQPPAAVSGQ
jgi:outer membrane protein assembly factor BamB